MKRRSIWSVAYKVLAVGLLLYGLTYGMLAELPELPGLGQSSRNLFYHVPMWFVVIVMMSMSLYHSIRLLRLTDPDQTPSSPPLLADIRAREAARLGMLFMVLGLITGTLWGRVAWKPHLAWTDPAAWWTNDPIIICALISLLIYLAYFLLRSSFSEPEQRARIAAAYNIFAFATLIPLYFIVPKMLPGLHPTSADSDAGGGSFIFMREGIDNTYRLLLYPSLLGFVLLGVWAYELRTRIASLRYRLESWHARHQYESQVSHP
ncbi:MAG: ABC transporter permease [Bacteroidetes bacterium]|nr:MAG: ABC transporter permease [Bacteroidota bacterium]